MFIRPTFPILHDIISLMWDNISEFIEECDSKEKGLVIGILEECHHLESYYWAWYEYVDRLGWMLRWNVPTVGESSFSSWSSGSYPSIPHHLSANLIKFLCYYLDVLCWITTNHYKLIILSDKVISHCIGIIPDIIHASAYRRPVMQIFYSYLVMMSILVSV